MLTFKGSTRISAAACAGLGTPCAFAAKERPVLSSRAVTFPPAPTLSSVLPIACAVGLHLAQAVAVMIEERSVLRGDELHGKVDVDLVVHRVPNLAGGRIVLVKVVPQSPEMRLSGEGVT